MTAAAEILTLLDPSTPDTWPQGILAAADLLKEESSRLSLGEDGPRIAAWMRSTARHWRGVVERHVRSVTNLNPPYAFCRECQARWAPPEATTAWPCPEVAETADDARAYLGGAS